MLDSVISLYQLYLLRYFSYCLLPTAYYEKKATHFCAAFLWISRRDSYFPTPRALSRPSINLPFSITEKLPV